jgi:hypothetical protein
MQIFNAGEVCESDFESPGHKEIFEHGPHTGINIDVGDDVVAGFEAEEHRLCGGTTAGESGCIGAMLQLRECKFHLFAGGVAFATVGKSCGRLTGGRVVEGGGEVNRRGNVRRAARHMSCLRADGFKTMVHGESLRCFCKSTVWQRYLTRPLVLPKISGIIEVYHL